jgi:N-acetylglucosaminyl-diphospho-decaprenol L-rhamnosyltransferase
VATSIGMVIITRNRRDGIIATLERIRDTTPRQVPVVVVDNGSSDGTPEAVVSCHPWCQVLELHENRGAAGRTDGARALDTDLVAFADDDSWWAEGALDRGRRSFDRHPGMALLAARVLVGPAEVVDPTSIAMASSPYRSAPGVQLPGPSVLGFLACGAVARRTAYLEVGGFHPRYGVGGEESLLALDLTARGWGCSYVDDVVAHHHPSPARDPQRRRIVSIRNDYWTVLLRRPVDVLASYTERLVAASAEDPALSSALSEAFAATSELWPERRLLPAWLEHQLPSIVPMPVGTSS